MNTQTELERAAQFINLIAERRENLHNHVELAKNHLTTEQRNIALDYIISAQWILSRVFEAAKITHAHLQAAETLLRDDIQNENSQQT
jgi:hypothetical protein